MMNENKNVEKINGIRQFAVVSIPWTIDWEALEITNEEDKENFIKNFIEKIQYKPIFSYNPNNPDEFTENTIGVVEEAYKKSLDSIELFCSMWLVVSPEYDMISTIDNMDKPLGLRLTPNAICIQFDQQLNKAYTEASQIHAGIASRIREAIDPSFAEMVKEYEKEHNEITEVEKSENNE